MIKRWLPVAALCFSAYGLFAGELETYSSKEHDFSIQYPAKWEKKERTSGTAVTLIAPKEDGKDAFRPNVNVIEQDIPSDADLKKFADASLAGVDKLLKGYKEVERKEISIGAAKALEVVYTYPFEDYELKAIVVFAVSGKRGYAITCASDAASFDKYKPAFDAIVNTFKAL